MTKEQAQPILSHLFKVYNPKKRARLSKGLDYDPVCIFLHVYLDTSGYLWFNAADAIFPRTSYFEDLFVIKLINPLRSDQSVEEYVKENFVSQWFDYL